MGFFNKLFGKKEKESLDQGLQKTRESFFSKITKAIAGKSTVDEELLDNLEEALVSADVGIETTVKIIDRIEKRVAKDKYLNSSELHKILLEEIESILEAHFKNQDLVTAAFGGEAASVIMRPLLFFLGQLERKGIAWRSNEEIGPLVQTNSI